MTTGTLRTALFRIRIYGRTALTQHTGTQSGHCPARALTGECSLHEEYGGGSLREILARIIEGDSRRGARVDLGIDLRPKALSLDGSPPSSLSHITKYKKLQWNSKGVGGRETKKTAGVTLRRAPLRKHKLDRSGALMVGRRRRACKSQE